MGKEYFHVTGCLVSSNNVLTCAHILYNRASKEEAKELRFIPGLKGDKGRLPIEVSEINYPEEYKNTKEEAS